MWNNCYPPNSLLQPFHTALRRRSNCLLVMIPLLSPAWAQACPQIALARLGQASIVPMASSSGKAIARPPSVQAGGKAKATIERYDGIRVELRQAIESGRLPASALGLKDRLHRDAAIMLADDIEVFVELHKKADAELRALRLSDFREHPQVLAEFAKRRPGQKPPAEDKIAKGKAKLRKWQGEQIDDVTKLATQAIESAANTSKRGESS